jgi:hypothetical protein
LRSSICPESRLELLVGVATRLRTQVPPAAICGLRHEDLPKELFLPRLFEKNPSFCSYSCRKPDLQNLVCQSHTQALGRWN